MKNGSYQHHVTWKKEVWPKLSLVVTSRHSMPPVVTRCHSLYHLLSFVATRCHLLYHSLSLVVTRCHSLSLVVPLVVTRCHSLSLVVPLVVTRCTTRLSFYKRSFSNSKRKLFESKGINNLRLIFLKGASFQEKLEKSKNHVLGNSFWKPAVWIIRARVVRSFVSS